MDFPKVSAGNYVIPSLLFAGILLFCITASSVLNPFPFISNGRQCSRPKNSTSDYDSVKPRDELELALAKASMANKTVIIAVVNKAYANQETGAVTTMLDVFLDSFWLGEGTRPLVKHILLVTVDQTAYDRCQFLHLNCFRLVTDGVDFGGEKLYMSEDFIKMMWRRTEFLLEVLKRGYNFIFTDIIG
ncbi:Nucleotide-diphospho-sugar transferase [Cucumis melo var. makuwa]|uniref:Nucleotide-diphospho-sugar transferase n=1 Tax=Cucumis melo var. makuwa TaxID=1194695 RepID=A0A5D3DDE3_CUCMM|nr:Nucleotide-diphospho-sugar transferase [Cucumis melo var. makuwa]TYK21586.1 Nucleotide-diphospho-sugar transferase [Cucumis melo var. makuwa]